MKSCRRLSIFLLLLAALLSACGAPSAQGPSQIDVVLTEGVKTMVASYFATQTAMAPLATPTSPATATLAATPSPAFTPLGSSNSTGTPLATATWPYIPPTLGTPLVTVTGTLPTATVNSGGPAYGCNNLTFIADMNYPSGTVVKPGENFTKTWKVANTGTCDWMYIYRLAFVSGTDFGAAWGNLGKIVTVNHWADLSVNLDAPRQAGTYSAYWRLTDGDGHMFGATLGVTIKVSSDEPADTPAPSETPTRRPTKTPTSTPTP